MRFDSLTGSPCGCPYPEKKDWPELRTLCWMMLEMTARWTTGRILPEWHAVLSCVRFRLRQACHLAVGDSRRVVIEAIPASNDVNLPGLATTETLTRHVNLNYFSEAVSWEGEERLADADSWRITGNPSVIVLGKS